MLSVTEEHYPLCIRVDGTWTWQGSPIHRPELVRLFASVLSRDDFGDYWLVTPVERGQIVVEDAPFLAIELNVDGNGQDQSLHFLTNVGDRVTAGPEHPIHMRMTNLSPNLRPYVQIRKGLDARIVRPVFYELGELAVTALEGSCLGVWSGGVFFPLDQC